jgi:hypothetical protein
MSQPYRLSRPVTGIALPLPLSLWYNSASLILGNDKIFAEDITVLCEGGSELDYVQWRILLSVTFGT